MAAILEFEGSKRRLSQWRHADKLMLAAAKGRAASKPADGCGFHHRILAGDGRNDVPRGGLPPSRPQQPMVWRRQQVFNRYRGDDRFVEERPMQALTLMIVYVLTTAMVQ